MWMLVIGHSLIRPLICSHCNAHSFTTLIHSLLSWNIFVQFSKVSWITVQVQLCMSMCMCSCGLAYRSSTLFLARISIELIFAFALKTTLGLFAGAPIVTWRKTTIICASDAINQSFINFCNHSSVFANANATSCCIRFTSVFFFQSRISLNPVYNNKEITKKWLEFLFFFKSGILL